MIQAIVAAIVIAAALAPNPARALPGFPDDVLMFIGGKERGDDDFTGLLPPYSANVEDVQAPVTIGYDFGLGRVAYGQVLPGLTRFFGRADSPATVDNPEQGSQVVIDVRRSYLKAGEGASLSYTYSAGELLLQNSAAPDRRCQASKCMYAEVSAYASVTDDQDQLVWFEEKTATLYLEDGVFKTSIGSNASGIGVRNPDWSWTADLGQQEATFSLAAAFSASFDLSTIDVGEGFTVNYSMGLRAVDEGFGAVSLARAFAVDPVTGDAGDGNGFGLIESGLAPIPEPSSWGLFGAGLVAMAVAVRRSVQAKVVAIGSHRLVQVCLPRPAASVAAATPPASS